MASITGTLPKLTDKERGEFEARGWRFIQTGSTWFAENEGLDRRGMGDTIEEAAESALQLEFEIEKQQEASEAEQSEPDKVLASEQFDAATIPRDNAIGLALQDLLQRGPSEIEQWEHLQTHGARDGDIRERLVSTIGKPGRSSSKYGIALIQARPTLRFWFGTYAVGEPTFEGKALIAEIRSALGIRKVSKAASDLIHAIHTGGAGAESDLAIDEQLSLFDYAQLDQADAIIIKRCTAEIRERVQTIKRNSLEIGERLREVKSRLEWGQFDSWLELEIGISRDTADRLIDVAEYAAKSPQFAESFDRFDKTARYLIVAPSTPDSARQELETLAETGQRVTATMAKEVIAAHKLPSNAAHNMRNESAGEDSGKITDAPKAAVAGVCRVCGCDEQHACAGDDGPCSWVEGEGDTLCTNCHGIMESRGLDEATLRARLQSSEEVDRLVMDEFGVLTVPEAKPKTAGDLSMASESAESVKQAEVVATGRTTADLLSIIKTHPDGMLPADLIRMGFTEDQIEKARVAGQIQKDIGKWYIAEKANAEPKPVAQAAPEKKAPPPVDELLKGRAMVITYSYFPFLPGKVSVGVRVGDDATKAAIDSLESTKVRYPDRVQEMIAAQIEADDKRAREEKTAARKATPPHASPTKKPPAKASGATKTKPAAPARKKPAAKKAAATKSKAK